MLGPFELERDGAVIDTARWQRRVASLFKYLVTAPGLRRLREEAIDTFWPDTSPETGAANLRLVAHRLRVALGGDTPSGFAPPVTLDQSWVALNPLHSWDVDLHQFEESALHAADDLTALEAALAVYRGEPLEEERYEDWAMPIREHLERTWRKTCLRFASLLEEHGSHEDAMRRSELLLEHDPIDEEALRVLLTALYRTGRRAEALRRYHQFEQRLADEIGVLPSPETVRALQRLDAECPHPPVQVPEVQDHPLPIGQFLGALPEGPLVAREDELQRILYAADLVETGAGRLVLLEGERGSGKTRLAQETMFRLRDRGFIVLAARCYEQQQQVPLYLLAEVTDSLEKVIPSRTRTELSGSWPSPGEPLPADTSEQQRLVRSLADLLSTLSEEHPVALLLDDLQWADPASLTLVQHLARRGAGHRFLLLAAYCAERVGRDHPLNRVTLELAREGLVERVPVYRLSLEGTSALVRALVGDMEAPDEFVEFVYRKTRGNPFFIDRMLQALGGRYSLVRQIAVGGMGRVFEAIDSATGEPVAVKIMFARTEADPKALQRFEQEGQILASLDHPNIVAIHGTYLDEFTNAIVMELLEGASLGDLMREMQLSLERIRHLAVQVTAGLACAHEHGVIHRDVKPDNVMVLEGDLVKVADFGVARLVRPKTSLTTLPSTGITIGTPLYLSPEQIEGHRVDGRADVYSLGAVLYQAVTGQPPFTGDDPVSIALKHVHQAPIPPRAINPHVPGDWEALILRALAKDPADRFQSAAAMGEALAALTTEPAVAEAVSRPVETPVAGQGEARPAELHPAAQGEAENGAAAVPSAARAGRWPRISRRTVLALSGVGAVAAVVLAAIVTSGVHIYPFSAAKSIPTKPAPAGSPVTTRPPSLASPANSIGIGPGQFHGPNGVAVDGLGHVYATDGGNGRIQEFTSGGAFRHQYGSAGHRWRHFSDPTQIVVARDGIILVADYKNARIQRIRRKGKVAIFLRPITWRPEKGSKAVGFNGVAADSQGNIYAAAVYRDTVVKFSPRGTFVTEWGGSGRGPGQFYAPNGIAVGPHDKIYVVDHLNNRIQEFAASGTPLRRWRGTGSSNGHFDRPEGIAVDSSGHVYVADTKNDRVVEFSTTRRYSGTIGETGFGCGQMLSPSGVAVGGDGSIYVSDYGNGRIDKFSASGKALWYTAGTRPQLCSR